MTQGTAMGAMKGDTRSLDYGSCEVPIIVSSILGVPRTRIIRVWGPYWGCPTCSGFGKFSRVWWDTF